MPGKVFNRRQNEGIALGYVAARVPESTSVGGGFVGLLAFVLVRQDPAEATGAAADSLAASGTSLMAMPEWASLFGPAFCAGSGHGRLLGCLSRP